MICSDIREVIRHRIGLHPEDDFRTEECWKQEVDILMRDISETIEFIKREATDDELYWISEVFEDVLSLSKSNDLLTALRDRVLTINDPKTRDSVEMELGFAASLLL